MKSLSDKRVSNFFLKYSLTLITIILMLLMALIPALAVDQISTRAPNDPQELSGLPDSGNYNYLELADMNYDGYTDIIAAAGGYPGGDPGGLYVYLNYNAQTIVGSSEGLPGAGNDYFGSVQAVDIDKDTNLDLVGAYESRWSRGNDKGIGIWLGNGAKGDTLTFSEATSPITSNSFDSAYCADINNDGTLDLVGASNKGIYAWEGQHSGSTLTWSEARDGLPTTGEYTGIMLGDIDKDGRLDIVAGSYSGKGISVYLCSKSGSISWSEGHTDTNLKTSGNSFDTKLVDLDDDGDLDIVAGIRGGMKVYLGNGNSGDRQNWWVDVSSGLPTSGDYYQVSVKDIDSDGNPDIACNYQVWSNTGSMHSSESYEWKKLDLGISESSSVGMYISDLNKDGYQDIIGCGWDTGVSAYLLYIESPEPPVERYYKVKGTVTSSVDSAPIVGATVNVDIGSLEHTTDADGKFEFNLLNGSYELTVTMKDFKTAKKLIEVSGSDLTINIQLLEIPEVPDPEYTLSGTITNGTAGEPLADAEIELQPGDKSTKTDADGNYELTTTNGSYVLTITLTGYETKTVNVEVSGGDQIKDLALQFKTVPPDDNDDDKDNDLDPSPAENENEDDYKEPDDSSSSGGLDLMLLGGIIAVVIIVLVIILVISKRKQNHELE